MFPATPRVPQGSNAGAPSRDGRGGGIRTHDFRIPTPARFHCATPRRSGCVDRWSRSVGTHRSLHVCSVPDVRGLHAGIALDASFGRGTGRGYPHCLIRRDPHPARGRLPPPDPVGLPRWRRELRGEWWSMARGPAGCQPPSSEASRGRPPDEVRPWQLKTPTCAERGTEVGAVLRVV